MEIKKGENMFYVGDSEDASIAKMTYVPTGKDKIIIDSTYVADQLRGQGVAGLLLDEAIAYARNESKKIIPLCPYVKGKMEGRAEYEDVLI